MRKKFYDDPSDLKEGMVLSKGDAIYFFKTFLSVEDGYLFCFEGYEKNNFSIFEKFSIDRPFSFCEKVYGYRPGYNFNDFPETKPGDYDALTRLVFAFIELSEGRKATFLKKRASFYSWWKDIAFDHFK